MMASPPLLPHSTSDNGTKASSIKNPSSANANTVAVPPEQQQQQGLKCPRCDSSNTKFCYYNNYSLSQPRHFCKTCRRYWTKGGALRNVPVGGGCRKSKKSKPGGVPSTLSLSCTSSSVSAGANSSFQLGMLPSGVFNGNNQFIGFNYPIVAGPVPVPDDHMYGYGTVNQHHHSSSIASSIESLSSINQDLHWKLQQQRLSMMFGGGGGGDQNKIAAATAMPLMEPISCQAADQGDRAEMCVPRSHDAAAAAAAGATATAWFLEGRINGNNGNNNNNNPASDWNGIATWSDMPQFSALQ